MRTRVVITLGLMIGVAACASRPEQSVMGSYVPPANPAPLETSTITPEPVAKSEPVKSVSIAPLPTKPLPIKSEPTKPVEVKPEPVKQLASKPVAQIQAPKPAPVSPPLPTGDDVLGLGPTKVTDLLGEPKMVRRETPAEVWQYAGADCVLHVFLYDDEPSGTFRVDHLEATDLQGSKAPTDTCLAGLVGK